MSFRRDTLATDVTPKGNAQATTTESRPHRGDIHTSMRQLPAWRAFLISTPREVTPDLQRLSGQGNIIRLRLDRLQYTSSTPTQPLKPYSSTMSTALLDVARRLLRCRGLFLSKYSSPWFTEKSLLQIFECLSVLAYILLADRNVHSQPP
jgi:hypothetical protein